MPARRLQHRDFRSRSPPSPPRSCPCLREGFVIATHYGGHQKAERLDPGEGTSRLALDTAEETVVEGTLRQARGNPTG